MTDTDTLDDLADAMMDLPVSDIAALMRPLRNMLDAADLAHLAFRLPMIR